jgi:hypothetical protein
MYEQLATISTRTGELQNRRAKIPNGSTRRDRIPEIDLDAVKHWIESPPKKPWDGLRWRKLTRHRNRFFYMAPSLIQRTPLRLLFDGFRAWSYHPKNNFQAQKVTGVSPPLPPAHF